MQRSVFAQPRRSTILATVQCCSRPQRSGEWQPKYSGNRNSRHKQSLLVRNCRPQPHIPRSQEGVGDHIRSVENPNLRVRQAEYRRQGPPGPALFTSPWACGGFLSERVFLAPLSLLHFADGVSCLPKFQCGTIASAFRSACSSEPLSD
jgi:hypothetical protein